jgi:hypothetical protein
MSAPLPFPIDECDHRHYHDCGHLIGIERDGVLIRGGDIYYSLLMVCPECRTLVTWKADRLKSLTTKWRKERHELLEELDIDKIILSVEEENSP